jgi:hypothetical protein
MLTWVAVIGATLIVVLIVLVIAITDKLLGSNERG